MAVSYFNRLHLSFDRYIFWCDGVFCVRFCFHTPGASGVQVSAAGLLVCLVSSFLSTDFFPVKEEKDIEWVSEREKTVLLEE